MTDPFAAIGFGVAFAAGLLSFLSPCVAPIVPGYLSLVSGVAIGATAGERRQTERVVIASILFVLGFSAVFVTLGALAGAAGGLLDGQRGLLTRLSGLVMVVMGLFVLGLVRVPLLYRERRFHFIDRPYGPLGTVLIGMAFGFGWTPCIGPVLASILLYAGSVETAQGGAILLLAYAVGLGVPFIAAAIGYSRFVSTLGWVRRRLPLLNAVSGVLLIGMGLLFATNQGYYLAYLSASSQRLLGPLLR
ncbi:MAG: cytochrome c biogenesis protein CcdA [Chloroflexota bacterium]|nr:cytochrome c biogenesis protein CcdA [Chloroflexota bacterium]